MSHKEKLDFACCYRCKFFQGAHSTIFGESWTCEKNNNDYPEIMENDYNYVYEDCSLEEIVNCDVFEIGEPNSVVLG